MRGLILASLKNKHAVVVFALTIVLLGGLSVSAINIDILPVFKAPAVMVLTFYGGMPPSDVERDITNRIERWTNMAAGMKRQESRSILGASVVFNYFYSNADPGEALTSVQSLAQSVVPNLPSGTLPPVVLPFDPTSTTPICMVALNSDKYGESTLYDVGRYEVRNQVMGIRGAVSPVVFGGKIRAVQIYLDRQRMQARDLAPLDVMKSVAASNIFLPTGELIVGDKDYFLESNSMFPDVEGMASIPLRTEHGSRGYVGDVGQPTDAAMLQTTIVRVEGKKQVYIPVMRQRGASTVEVVDELKEKLPTIQGRLTRPGIRLELIMDQSVYVRQSIRSLATEAGLGAVLCSLVILIFLGRPQMTAIAVLTIPISILSAVALLYATGQTINVMTLSGIAMAIGPMVDSAIICLENTDRLLEEGEPLHNAALEGASQVALPELVSSLSTLMVLSPLALIPGVSSFLFQPLALAVAFAMATAYLLSRTLVPAAAVSWLKESKDYDKENAGPIRRAFQKWQTWVERATERYVQALDAVLAHRVAAVLVAFATLVLVVGALVLPMRREFFPEVDGGAFEIFVRAPSGTRLEATNDRIDQVERFIREKIPEKDLRLLLSEIGATPDWSSGYTKNSAKMDAIVRVQLEEDRDETAQHYVRVLRRGFRRDKRFADLEFAFNAGGLIRGALNEGKTTPINVRVTGKDVKKTHEIADHIRREAAEIDGVVDARILQRQDYPTYKIAVDRAKAADLGLTQEDVMKSVIATFNSSIQFNKDIFWIDAQSGNQYFVGVQYPEKAVESMETLLDVPVTGVNQWKLGHRVAALEKPSLIDSFARTSDRITAPVPLANLVKISRSTIATEATHIDIRPTIDVNLGVEGRDLGHVADDIHKLLNEFGEHKGEHQSHTEELGTTWHAYDPDTDNQEILEGTEIVLSGEYSRMKQTFHDLAIGLVLAVILIYFMMVALTQSFIVPLCVLMAVPLILIGAMPALYFTQTSVNVQSLMGFIFSVGIVVANTVLLTDVAQQFRENEQLSPRQAIRKAAKIRARPVTMTALAAFFAMIPTALALEKGSEANAPLGRAILGGLLAAWPSTLLIVPALYCLLLRDDSQADEQGDEIGEGDDAGQFDEEH
ncbi:MAG TPA: efflux RND transporter permease subunit [Pirellulales bacterium]|nr:efflux RND transporter permease subunit [Pirellulales bacterium]